MTIPTRNERSRPAAGGMTRRMGARYHSVARTTMRPTWLYIEPGNQDRMARTRRIRMKIQIRFAISSAPGNIAGSLGNTHRGWQRISAAGDGPAARLSDRPGALVSSAFGVARRAPREGLPLARGGGSRWLRRGPGGAAPPAGPRGERGRPG